VPSLRLTCGITCLVSWWFLTGFILVYLQAATVWNTVKPWLIVMKYPGSHRMALQVPMWENQLLSSWLTSSSSPVMTCSSPQLMASATPHALLNFKFVSDLIRAPSMTAGTSSSVLDMAISAHYLQASPSCNKLSLSRFPVLTPSWVSMHGCATTRVILHIHLSSVHWSHHHHAGAFSHSSPPSQILHIISGNQIACVALTATPTKSLCM